MSFSARRGKIWACQFWTGHIWTLALALVVAIQSAAAQDVKVEIIEPAPAARAGQAEPAAAREGDLLELDLQVQFAKGAGESETIPSPSAAGRPYVMQLGIDPVISGFAQGVSGMQVGERRKIEVPAALAYGERGSGVVPSGADLIFDVRLLGIRGGREEDWKVTKSGLRTLDLMEGDADAPAIAPGAKVKVHYTGWLADGTRFDSSRDRAQPFTYFAGQKRVIAGWDEGVMGMRTGQRRKLVVPPALAYGERGGMRGKIPPNATLTYEVEILEVQPADERGPTLMDPKATESLPGGLLYVDLLEGNGETPRSGDRIIVHYAGYVEDGRKFTDSSEDGGPHTFIVGVGQLIPSWELALASMQAGGKRRIRVPPEMGFGPRGDGKTVPGNAILFFDIELLTVLH